MNPDFGRLGRTLNQEDLCLTNSTVSVRAYRQSGALTRQGGTLAFVFVWLFTFAVYARPQDIFSAIDPLHLPLIFGTCAGLTYLGGLISGRIRLQQPRELVLVLLLTVWFILGVPFAYWRRGSFEVLTQTWLKTAFIFFLLTQTLTTTRRIRKLLWAVILSELLATTASIILQGKAGIQQGARLEGVNLGMLGWNFLGIAAAMTIPYMAAMYISHPSLPRSALLLITLGAMMWMLMLTASRGGFLSVIFSITLTWWFVLRRSFRGRIVGLIVALCLAVAAARAPGVFWVRLQTIWDGSEAATNTTAASAEESTEQRRSLLKRSIGYTLQYPIFGVGLGNFPVINGNELGRPEAWHGTHNTFTEISSEAGLPALVLFLLLLNAILRHAKDASRESNEDAANAEINLMARATLVSVVSFAFSGFFAHLAYEYYFYYPAGIATGLWAIVHESARAPDPSAESPGAIPSTRWSAK